MQNFIKQSATRFRSYSVDIEKKLIDDAKNNTAVACAGSK